MTRLAKFIDHLSLLLVIPALFYLLVPSSVFLDARRTVVEGRDVIFTRFTPYGEVLARWHSEITVLDGTDRECSSGEWSVATYQDRKSNAVTYELGDWALPCLEMGERYTLSTTRQVLLWGWLPLRPISTIDTIEIPEATG